MRRKTRRDAAGCQSTEIWHRLILREPILGNINVSRSVPVKLQAGSSQSAPLFESAEKSPLLGFVFGVSGESG